MKERRLKFHNEAVRLYGPLYFTHPNYLEDTELSQLLRLTHRSINEKESEILEKTFKNFSTSQRHKQK
jgi:hypothetical protein